MSKRSFCGAVALAVLAGLAFATPSHAAPTTIDTKITFSVSGGGTATDVTVTYSNPAIDPIVSGSLTLVSAGGLTISPPISEASNKVTVDFSPSSGTVGTLEFTFMTNTPASMYDAELSGVTAGQTGTISASVVGLAAPEPASFALLGIGVTGFLACRRLFKRTARGRAS
jgi:hypothetical protein